MVKSRLYNLTFTIHPKSSKNRDVIWSALEPEFSSIDSKRVEFHSKSNKNGIVFHLATSDVNSLRAAATTLMRLYMVADGVHHFMVKKNG
jgi:tRNA threonylcarbamoyladenosine modification (KEOPS) complex  Pcc1 subunit